MSQTHKRILVVERDPLLRMLLVSTLQDAGYEVFDAPRGDEALELLHEPDNIDLVVTSIRLEGADGIEVAKRARTHGQPVPVVFASGSALLGDAVAPAPTRRLQKPYTMGDLHAAISSLLTETN